MGDGGSVTEIALGGHDRHLIFARDEFLAIHVVSKPPVLLILFDFPQVQLCHDHIANVLVLLCRVDRA